METSPNVLLIVLDSVRARNTSLHGHDSETTPCIDDFAARATTYTQARAAGLGSIQSHASMFTGLHVQEHGLVDSERRLRPGETVFDDLASGGYDTGVFSGNTFLTQVPIGLRDAFQHVETGLEARLPFPDGLDPRNVNTESTTRHLRYLAAALGHEWPARSVWNGIVETLPRTVVDRVPAPLRPRDLTAEVYADAFLDWQAERTGPWAACVNFMDAHMPVLPTDEHNWWADAATREECRDADDAVWPYISGDAPLEQLQRFEALYDGCIHQADAQVGRLLDALDRRGELAETLVVVTADHGEGYGEPDPVRDRVSVGHGAAGGLVEEVVHVPLVVKFPGQTEPETVTAPATLAQFPAAVWAVRSGSWDHDEFVPEGIVVSAMSGITPSVARPAARYLTDIEPYERSGQAVYVPGDDGVRKYVRWGGVRAAFDCVDARTTRELDADPAAFADMFVDSDPKDVLIEDDIAVSGDVRRRLEELGYA